MNLSEAIEQYVAHRHSLGMKFVTQEKLLRRFGRKVGPIDVERVDQATVQAFIENAQPPSRCGHLSTLRGFFRFAMDRHLSPSVPLPTIVPKAPPYAKPYIYSPDELRRLLDATQVLNEINRFGETRTGQALTMRTLILLLYGTGMRISEAVSLTLDDLHLDTNRILVRNAKFGKNRLVPIGPKLAAALKFYVRRRGIFGRKPPSTTSFFLWRFGTQMSRHYAEVAFAKVRAQAGVARFDGAFFQPRLHDLRHTFAVHRLEAWYKVGANVQLLLPKLSTYLGHVGLAETQHYLTMTPELLRQANRRFEHYAVSEVRHDR